MSKVPIVNQLSKLRTDQLFYAVTGNYKEFKAATKAYAKLAVENFDLVTQTKMPSIQAPLFSKQGLNMLKVWFLNKFRIKTPEEKMLKTLSQRRKFEQMM